MNTNKANKAIKSIIVCTLTICILSTTAIFAANAPAKLYVNGSILKDAETITSKSTRLYPIKPIAEKLAYNVDYNMLKKAITLTKDDSIIKLTINKADVTINGSQYTLTTAPQSKHGKAYVPAEFIENGLNCFSNKMDLSNAELDFERIDIFSKEPVPLNSQNASISTEKFDFEKSIDGNDSYTHTVGYSVIIPQFSNMKDAKFQDSINKGFIDHYEAIKKSVEEALKDVEQSKYKYTVEQDLTYAVISDDNDILSLTLDGYDYFGGAHGMPTKTAINIDFANSKILLLSDIFHDYEDFLLKKIIAIAKADPQNYELYTEPTYIPTDNFYLENGNLVVYYPPYELAPYARGYVYFSVPLKELSAYINASYLNILN